MTAPEKHLTDQATARGADFGRQVTLLELVDRLLEKGVVLDGQVTLAVADVDLVYIGLRALISSVSSLQTPDQPPS